LQIWIYFDLFFSPKSQFHSEDQLATTTQTKHHNIQWHQRIRHNNTVEDLSCHDKVNSKYIQRDFMQHLHRAEYTGSW